MAAPEYVPSAWPTRPARALAIPPATAVDGHPSGRPRRPPARRAPLGRPGPRPGLRPGAGRRFAGRLGWPPGEDEHDVVAGCLGVATARASLFGRAPVIHDLELAFTLWGYLDAPRPTWSPSARRCSPAPSHHYWDQRASSTWSPRPPCG